MNKNTLIIIGLITAAIIIGGLIISMKQKDTTMMVKTNESMPAETGTSEEKMMMDDKQLSNYIDYSQAALASAHKNGGKPVLFFKASWCPTCQAADKEFTSRLDQIPSGVTILKVDYDTEKDLKAKYGITYQHTFVQVDANGNELAKWNGGDIDNLKSHLK